jgi:hypothetical protein
MWANHTGSFLSTFYELFEPRICMASAIIFLAMTVQKRGGLNLVGIGAREVVGVIYFSGL